MSGDAWQDYLAAAQRLDAVRRGVVTAAAEQEQAVRAARDELAGLRARLATQHNRLREQGVPQEQLAPEPADVAAAVHSISQRPAAVLAALRQARATADAADAVAAGSGPVGRGPWARNLLVYGPFAAVVFVVHLALYVLVPSSLPLYAAVCGLVMPAIAFGLGWLMVGLVFPGGPGGRVERTPLAGAVVCFAPVVITCMGAGVLALLG